MNMLYTVFFYGVLGLVTLFFAARWTLRRLPPRRQRITMFSRESKYCTNAIMVLEKQDYLGRWHVVGETRMPSPKFYLNRRKDSPHLDASVLFDETTLAWDDREPAC